YLKSANATYYLHGRGYTSEDFERVTSQVAGKDMHDFFARHVRGVEAPPYMDALKVVGLRLVKAPAQMPYTAGITLERRDPLVRIGAINQGSAAEDAELQVGDIITTIGTTNVTQDNWRQSLNKFKRGDTVPVSVQRNRKTVNVSLKLGEPAFYEYRIEEQNNASTEATTLRAAWLNGSGF
ncbi:MAG: PDZ domain-containing protein, partial [Pyrinomonadaceae bacterium]